jgi:hypothetical protein
VILYSARLVIDAGITLDYDQSHWAPAQRKGTLPTFYYHDHFLEVLDFVECHYAHVLLAEHVDFIQDFRVLPKQAQCLYVRLVNRKGRLFARNRLRYPELGDLSPVVERLQRGGWVSAPGETHFHDILEFLTRTEIYSALLPRMAGISRSLKKSQLLELVREHVSPEDLLAGLDTRRILVQCRADQVRYLLYLYFGEVRDGLSRFTMRDLGIVQTQTLRDTYEPRFSDRDEALEHYYFASRFKRCQKASAAEYASLIDEAARWPDANFSGSAALRDDLAYKLGRSAERNEDVDTALFLYRAGESAECSERIVRLLLRNGAREEAREYLERCLENPRTDEEWRFACDIYERKFRKKRTSTLTDVLRAADTVAIDESKSGAPERAVVEYFEQRGIAAYRSENQLWRTFFGLLFWELLFADEDAGERQLLGKPARQNRRALVDNRGSLTGEKSDSEDKYLLLRHSQRRFSLATVDERRHLCAHRSCPNDGDAEYSAAFLQGLRERTLWLSGPHDRGRRWRALHRGEDGRRSVTAQPAYTPRAAQTGWLQSRRAARAVGAGPEPGIRRRRCRNDRRTRRESPGNRDRGRQGSGQADRRPFSDTAESTAFDTAKHHPTDRHLASHGRTGALFRRYR